MTYEILKDIQRSINEDFNNIILGESENLETQAQLISQNVLAKSHVSNNNGSYSLSCYDRENKIVDALTILNQELNENVNEHLKKYDNPALKDSIRNVERLSRKNTMKLFQAKKFEIEQIKISDDLMTTLTEKITHESSNEDVVNDLRSRISLRINTSSLLESEKIRIKKKLNKFLDEKLCLALVKRDSIGVARGEYDNELNPRLQKFAKTNAKIFTEGLKAEYRDIKNSILDDIKRYGRYDTNAFDKLIQSLYFTDKDRDDLNRAVFILELKKEAINQPVFDISEIENNDNLSFESKHKALIELNKIEKKRLEDPVACDKFLSASVGEKFNRLITKDKQRVWGLTGNRVLDNVERSSCVNMLKNAYIENNLIETLDYLSRKNNSNINREILSDPELQKNENFNLRMGIILVESNASKIDVEGALENLDRFTKAKSEIDNQITKDTKNNIKLYLKKKIKHFDEKVNYEILGIKNFDVLATKHSIYELSKYKCVKEDFSYRRAVDFAFDSFIGSMYNKFSDNFIPKTTRTLDGKLHVLDPEITLNKINSSMKKIPNIILNEYKKTHKMNKFDEKIGFRLAMFFAKINFHIVDGSIFFTYKFPGRSNHIVVNNQTPFRISVVED